jgi:hypothetical protein
LRLDNLRHEEPDVVIGILWQGRDRSREGMLRSEEEDDVNEEELFDHGLFGWPAPQSVRPSWHKPLFLSLPFDLSLSLLVMQSRTVRARLQNTASRSSQRRKVADQKRAQRKEVTRRRLSGGNAAASQTLSSTPRPNDTHQVRTRCFPSRDHPA